MPKSPESPSKSSESARECVPRAIELIAEIAPTLPAGFILGAGAVAVGVGSALLDANAIASCDFAPITTNARRIVENVRAARQTT